MSLLVFETWDEQESNVAQDLNSDSKFRTFRDPFYLYIKLKTWVREKIRTFCDPF